MVFIYTNVHIKNQWFPVLFVTLDLASINDLISNRHASHVVETLLQVGLLHHHTSQLYSDLVLSLSEHCRGHFHDLSMDQYGCHVMSTLIKILAG